MMNHPSPDWKNLKTNELKKSKAGTKIISQHFRFSRLRDKEDYLKCYLWEKARTEIFLNIKPMLGGVYFPFNIEGFPTEPYLSYSFSERSKFELGLMRAFSRSQNDSFYNLLDPHLGSTGEIELGSTENTTFVCHTPTLKVPIELHIHPFWSSNELVELFRKQIDNVLDKVRLNQKELEEKGHSLMRIKSKKPIKTFQKYLKLLGHFRLLYCVKLDSIKARKHYGKDYYWDEPTMKREIKKCYPNFKDLLISS